MDTKIVQIICKKSELPKAGMFFEIVKKIEKLPGMKAIKETELKKIINVEKWYSQSMKHYFVDLTLA